jgi:uncharacterized protein (DUF849 family)
MNVGNFFLNEMHKALLESALSISGRNYMLKRIVIGFVVIAIAVAGYLYFMQEAEQALEINIEEVVGLSKEESQAIALLNEEILEDECNDYAKEDDIEEDKLKAYLASCVKQLKIEATTIEPPRSDAEIKELCKRYAKEDAVKEEKLQEYIDLCIVQIKAEDTTIEPEEPEEPKKME